MQKYRLYFLYTVFGIITAAVDILTYTFCVMDLKIGLIQSNSVAWGLSVIVAYITNRKWVFKSKNSRPYSLAKEFIEFFGCRWLTFVTGTWILCIGVNTYGYGEIIMKFASTAFVVIVNYVASKLIIFKVKK